MVNKPVSARHHLASLALAVLATFSTGLHAQTTMAAGDTTYRGAFTTDTKTGAVNGSGTVQWKNGNRYEGPVVNTQLTGKGNFTWANGDTYVGDMVNAQPHGQGTYTFKSGDRYAGAWRNGQKHGQGRYTFANGSVWEGEFANDQQFKQGVVAVAAAPEATKPTPAPVPAQAATVAPNATATPNAMQTPVADTPWVGKGWEVRRATDNVWRTPAWVFNADGTAEAKGLWKGTWEKLPNGRVQLKFITSDGKQVSPEVEFAPSGTEMTMRVDGKDYGVGRTAELAASAAPSSRAGTTQSVEAPRTGKVLQPSTKLNYQQEISKHLLPDATFVDFTADASVIASCKVVWEGARLGTVRLVRFGTVIDIPAPPQARLKACDRLAVSPDGELLAVIYGTPIQAVANDLVLYSTADLSKNRHYPNVNTVAFSKDSGRIAMGSAHLSANYIGVDDVSSWLTNGQVRNEFRVPSFDPVNRFANNTTSGARPSHVYHVAFRPNGDVIALLRGDYSKNRWITLDGQLGTVKPEEWMQSITDSSRYAINSDQSLVASPTRGSEVALFEQLTGTLRRKIGNPIDPSGNSTSMSNLRGLTFSHDGRFIASCEKIRDSGKRLIRVTEVDSSRSVGESTTDADCTFYSSFRFTPDKTLLIGNGEGGMQWLPNAVALIQRETEQKEAAAKAKAAREAEQARLAAIESEKRRKQEQARFDAAMGAKDPQAMYLAAGKYEREGDSYSARKVYEQIIDRFPSSPFAAKANDQLLANQRSDKARSDLFDAQRDAQRQQGEAAYKACMVQSDACYKRNNSFKGCTLPSDCNSLR